ncbi:MAG: GNAT family N-acetyltransferase [Candidatus Odinarchaeota archaeon]
MQDYFLNHAEGLISEARQDIARTRSVDYIEKASKDRTIFVAETGGKIIGMGALRGNEVRHMYVSENHQKKGLGSAMLRVIEEEARKRGMKTIIVNAVFSSEGFYAKNKFTRTKKGTIKIHGNLIESVLMERKL